MIDTLDSRDTAPAGKVWRVVQGFVASLLAIFSLGVAAGASAALLDGSGTPWLAVLIVVGALALAALSAWYFWRLDLFGNDGEPVSPKTLRARRLIGLSGLVGGVIGVVLTFAGGGFEEPGFQGAFSNAPADPTIAIVVVLVYALLLPLLGWYWHRTIDEHEAQANATGAIAGIYAYSIITPSWWLLSRADLAPPQQPMIVFLIVLSVWGLVWIARRFH